MLADRTRLASLLAVTLLALVVAGCSRGENSVRIGLLTDCRGIYSGYEDQMLAGAELPLLRRGARLTNGKPSGGVSGARVAGRAVELVRGCTEESENSILVEEARRLVEDEGVDAVVGPFGEEDSLIARELARKYPDVVFIPAWSGAQELTLRHPAANVYRFDTDEAQDVAGLGSYAYRKLGWRRAVTVEDGTFVGWQEEAAFVAEFCALGGKMAARLYLGGSISKLSDPRDPKVARTLKQADGVVLLTYGALLIRPWLLPTLTRTLGSLPNRLVVGAYLIDDSNSFVHVVGLPAGVVGVSSTPPADATPRCVDTERSSRRRFPGCLRRTRRREWCSLSMTPWRAFCAGSRRPTATFRTDVNGCVSRSRRFGSTRPPAPCASTGTTRPSATRTLSASAERPASGSSSGSYPGSSRHSGVFSRALRLPALAASRAGKRPPPSWVR